MIKDYEIENDESDFQEQLEANRFNEIKQLFQKVLDAFKKDNSNDKLISDAIEKNVLNIGQLVNEFKKIKFNIPEIKVPNVTVNSNQQELLDASNTIIQNQQSIIDILEEIKNKKTDYKVEVTEWSLGSGRIKTLIIKAI